MSLIIQFERHFVCLLNTKTLEQEVILSSNLFITINLLVHRAFLKFMSFVKFKSYQFTLFEKV